MWKGSGGGSRPARATTESPWRRPRALLPRQPGDEQAVGGHVLPIGDEAAGDFPAVTPEEALQFLAPEPSFPLRSLQPAIVFDVLVDDGDGAAGLDHPAELGNSGVNVNGVLEASEVLPEGSLGYKSSSEQSGDKNPTAAQSISKSEHPLTLGANPAAADREFHGKIDEVAILSRVLSEQEIREMYKVGKP